MIRPGSVLNRPMSVHSLNTGVAIAIGGNVVIDRTSASSANFIGNFSRASA